MKTTRRLILVGLSLGFVALVGISVAGSFNFLFFAILFSAAIAMVAIQQLFPHSGLFPITFASLAAVYASIFALFVEGLFFSLGKVTLGIGFSTPILLFIAGCWWQQDEIRVNVADWAITSEKGLLRTFLWQLPVWFVGLSVYVLFGIEEKNINTDAALLAAMGVIGLIVFFVSHEVATFLIDIGLLLEEFLTRISRLTVPAFAFLAFYAILVIAFAAAYGIISRSSPLPHFRIGDEYRSLTYFEALYFSVVTLATVGYGDIVPTSNLVRMLVAFEVIIGVLLILFGVSELLEYAHERQRKGRRKRKRPSRSAKDMPEHPNPVGWNTWNE
jgi:voltage-gated potassium channel